MKIAFLYSGSGAQHQGMLKDFYDNVTECKHLTGELSEYFGVDVARLCLKGSDEELRRPENMFTSVYTMDLVCDLVMKINGIRPDVAMGYSMGEWAAATAAGVFDLKTAVQVVKTRSRAIISATPKDSGMIVVMGQKNERVIDICESIEGVFVSNFNYDGQVTISGTKEGLDELETYGIRESIVLRRIPVNVMSHCPMINSAGQELKRFVESIEFKDPAFPIVTNYSAKPIEDGNILKNDMVLQLTNPVRFEESFIEMHNMGCDMFVEIGAGRTLIGFIRKISKKLGVEVSFCHVEDMDTLKQAISLIKGQ